MIWERFQALRGRYAALSRIKKISTFCLFVNLILCMGTYVAFYNIGWVSNDEWAFSYLLMEFLCVAILSLTLLITWIASLSSRQDRLWTSGVFFAFVALPALGGRVFSPSGGMVILGVRDHMTRACSLDDLRRFARDIHALGDMDHLSQYARDNVRVFGRNVNIVHGDVSRLTAFGPGSSRISCAEPAANPHCSNPNLTRRCRPRLSAAITRSAGSWRLAAGPAAKPSTMAAITP